ncbi:MAG: hypothetical protein VKJ24_13400 [Synechococcales bacterium]|nr:hypothetical protein [Synechococcales bacterium]
MPADMNSDPLFENLSSISVPNLHRDDAKAMTGAEIDTSELSEAELEAIAGGVFDVSFSMLTVRETSQFFSQVLSNGSQTSISTISNHQRSIFGFQFTGRFASFHDCFMFFAGFRRLFGR